MTTWTKEEMANLAIGFLLTESGHRLLQENDARIIIYEAWTKEAK